MFEVGEIGSSFPSTDKRWDEKGRTKISYIYVTFDDYGIKSLQFIYFHKRAHVESQKHGYKTGHHIKRVKLESDEYVTALSAIDWKERITSLTFHTNKRKHGPFCRIYEYLKTQKRELDVGICNRSEFGGLFGSFSYSDYGGNLTSIGMYVSHITSSIDATGFGATYDHHLIGYQSFTHDRTLLDYQTPKIVDGFPVKPNKAKLKDRIFSKLAFKKAIRLFFRNFLD